MSLLSRILRKKQVSRSAMISILGPSKSGKTTFIRYLETGEPQLEAPLSTYGMDIRRN